MLGASVALCLGSCTARIEGASGASAADPGPVDSSGGNLPPVGFQGAPSGLRRLTVAQYRSSLADLFGGDVALTTTFEADTVLNGFASIGATRMALSPLGTEQFESAALEVAKQVFEDPARRSQVTGCDPASDASCTARFIERFGLRAWRRPLTPAEVTRYAGVASAAQQAIGDAWAGPQYAAVGLLQSPHFLYRVELGSPDPRDAKRYRFDDFEVATRLSFFVWNSTPDDALLSAAAAGQLASPDGLLGEAQRLLASPRAALGLANFFDEYLQLLPLSELPQLPQVFPQVTTTLGASMRSETQRFMSQHALSGGDIRDVFDSRQTFVNEELANLYGVSGVAGSELVAVELPATGMRAGLLGQGSFLALNAHADSASATLRGKFIREVLLCQAIPPPPPDVVTSLPDTSASGPQTRRQKLEIHNSVASCAACHKLMDPLGLGLENFDGIGAYRTQEVGLPIDPRGELDGVAFSNPIELGQALKQHPDVTKCIVRSVYRYATGHLETDGEQSLIDGLQSSLVQGGHDFSKLLVGVIESPGFRYSGAPQ